MKAANRKVRGLLRYKRQLVLHDARRAFFTPAQPVFTCGRKPTSSLRRRRNLTKTPLRRPASLRGFPLFLLIVPRGALAIPLASPGLLHCRPLGRGLIIFYHPPGRAVISACGGVYPRSARVISAWRQVISPFGRSLNNQPYRSPPQYRRQVL